MTTGNTGTQAGPDIASAAFEPAEAASMLAWLVEAGADEVMLEEPVNRFEQPQAAPLQKKAEAPAPVTAPRTVPAQPRRQGDVPATPEVAETAAAACASLSELVETFRDFDVNGLRKSAQHFNFLDQVEGARVLVLADRPRTEEEQEGGVFAGQSALLLSNMLKAVGLALPRHEQGEQVSLANLVPWRPPGNRNPIDIEVTLCLPFARRMLAFVRPQMILTLGALPGKWLANGGESVALQRGKWLTVDGLGISLLATFHPFELLNYPERKRLAWRDLLMFRERLDHT